MYVCLCNALTDKHVKQAVAAKGVQRPAEVYEACGCRAQCGQCVLTVLRMLREHARPIELGIQSAA